MAAGVVPKCFECLRRCVDFPVTHYVQELSEAQMSDGSTIWIHGLKVGYCAGHAPINAKLIDFENSDCDTPIIVEHKGS